ncbi:MAG: hypothetical protein F4Y48_00895 [Gammaproteobacteria bacterium]|nr:hypothetical protein [Gammaproteobacteria bacterium]
MIADPCPREEAVLKAARAGGWSDELAAHVARCDSCREASTAIRWMIELGQTVDSGPASLPDPHLIWLKARIRRRSGASWRTLLPILIACGASAIGLGMIVAPLPGNAWRSLREWLASAGIAGWELPSLASPGPLAIAWMPAALLLMLLLVVSASEA